MDKPWVKCAHLSWLSMRDFCDICKAPARYIRLEYSSNGGVKEEWRCQNCFEKEKEKIMGEEMTKEKQIVITSDADIFQAIQQIFGHLHDIHTTIVEEFDLNSVTRACLEYDLALIRQSLDVIQGYLRARLKTVSSRIDVDVNERVMFCKEEKELLLSVTEAVQFLLNNTPETKEPEAQPHHFLSLICASLRKLK